MYVTLTVGQTNGDFYLGKLSIIMTQHTPLYSRLCFIIGLSRDASFIQSYKKEFRGPESGAVWRDR